MRKKNIKKYRTYLGAGDAFCFLCLYLELLKPEYQQDKKLIEDLRNIREMGFVFDDFLEKMDKL